MTDHNLKTWPQYFEAVRDGKKTFEVRRNDRGFQVGDRLSLQEWDPDEGKYTGRELHRYVSYMLTGPALGVEPGFCVLALSSSRQ